MSEKQKRRLNRQFEMIERVAPAARRILAFLRRPRVRFVRVPLGILLVLGGIFSILPVLGIWMLPLGLLLLAIDLPFLRPPVNWGIVKGRRKWAMWRRSRRNKS